MCGIFGIVSLSDKIDHSKLIAVSKVLKHRGPDDEGYLLSSYNQNILYSYKGDSSPSDLNVPHISEYNHDCNIALVHRRLSIIDLSNSGHQPMSYGDNRYWIILNGEIYNYIEIRAELESKGYDFKSNTDTEVVLAAYSEWGSECVSRFNGMWAFAIWDSQKKQLFLSRDRLGIKPLYYYFSDGLIIFSSEIKGILSYLGTKPNFNQNKIREYLIKGQIIIGESEETMFVDIRQLMPATNIIFKNQELHFNKYWEINIKISNKSREYHVDSFKELFYDSIKLRLRSDVEVGSCLSGGIDSSSIVAFGSKEFNKIFNTFSAIWPNTRHDEYKYMKLVNDQYNTKANYIESDESEVLQLIDDITWHQEIPIAGSSLIAQWNIMKKAREQNTPVLLDGQGADEVLSGYPVYLIPYINELILTGKLNYLYRFIRNAEHTGYGIKRIVKQQLKKYLYHTIKQPLLPIYRNEMSLYKNSLKFNYPIESNFLPSYLKEHIEKSNLPTLLHFEDRNSMAHSIEARVPFLDYRLVEFSLNIPSEHKIGDGFTKTILRDAMKDYVPNEILMRRDKIGFSTPIEENLNDEASQVFRYMENYLMESDIWNQSLIDKKVYQKKNLFALYSLQRFLDIYSKRE